MTFLITSAPCAELLNTKSLSSLPLWLVTPDMLPNILNGDILPENLKNWVKASGFKAKSGAFLAVSDGEGRISAGLFVIDKAENNACNQAQLIAGQLARKLPPSDWHLENAPENPQLFALGFLLGGYQFNRYKTTHQPGEIARLFVADLSDIDDLRRISDASAMTRDLINTPTNDMGPDALEQVMRDLAQHYAATIMVTTGEELLHNNLPMIHAVGRAGAIAPRLIDLVWGDTDAPKVTLVGKGVCFDTGGLDIKPASGMLLMKKDMGGAANVLGLARMIMDAQLPVRLRVLVPAVENSIAGNAFRPGDVLTSRQGLTVEIGNTDAEGRLVLADALTLADEEQPEFLIDMATLTGAARVALGPDLPPFYSHNEELAAQISQASDITADPLWRMPLWAPYQARLSSKIADVNNVTSDGFAGSITAALFLSRFVKQAKNWGHFDIYGWTPVEKPSATIGGAAQGIRALYQLLQQRFPADKA